MADASTYLERSNRVSTHIYGLLVTPRKRGVESAELTSILKQHGLKKRCAENRADFDRVKEVFFTLPLRNFNQSML